MNREEITKMRRDEVINSFLKNMDCINNSCKRSTDTMNRVKEQQNRIDCLLDSIK